jgi:hypothetical protein
MNILKKKNSLGIPNFIGAVVLMQFSLNKKINLRRF